MDSPVDTLKALRVGVEMDAAHDPEGPAKLAALDAAIVSLSDSEQIRTVMRIEHEGRTFSVDGWAGPLVKQWRDAALSGGEAVAWMRRTAVYRARDSHSGEPTGRREGERIITERQVYEDDIPLYTTPRAVGDGMVPPPAGSLPLIATGPYVDRIIRLFREHPDDDATVRVLTDFGNASIRAFLEKV